MAFTNKYDDDDSDGSCEEGRAGVKFGSGNLKRDEERVSCRCLDGDVLLRKRNLTHSALATRR
jgi:hypothetical protein